MTGGRWLWEELSSFLQHQKAEVLPRGSPWTIIPQHNPRVTPGVSLQDKWFSSLQAELTALHLVRTPIILGCSSGLPVTLAATGLWWETAAAAGGCPRSLSSGYVGEIFLAETWLQAKIK